MKFAVFIVLSCLCICLANSVTVTNWGNVNARTLGTENVVVKSSILQVKTYVLTYPQQPSNFEIAGIKHLDYKQHPVKVQFLKGGTGQRDITLKIESQRGHGINSTFIFYTL